MAVYLFIDLTRKFPQLINVTFSFTCNVSASAPSIYALDDVHTFFIPISAFWDEKTIQLAIVRCVVLSTCCTIHLTTAFIHLKWKSSIYIHFSCQKLEHKHQSYVNFIFYAKFSYGYVNIVCIISTLGLSTASWHSSATPAMFKSTLPFLFNAV